MFVTGSTVQRVRAVDDDNPNTPNGQVNYRIESGSLNKFTIDPNSGDVTTTSTFDIQTDPGRNRYQMIVSLATFFF